MHITNLAYTPIPRHFFGGRIQSACCLAYENSLYSHQLCKMNRQNMPPTIITKATASLPLHLYHNAYLPIYHSFIVCGEISSVVLTGIGLSTPLLLLS